MSQRLITPSRAAWWDSLSTCYVPEFWPGIGRPEFGCSALSPGKARTPGCRVKYVPRPLGPAYSSRKRRIPPDLRLNVVQSVYFREPWLMPSRGKS